MDDELKCPVCGQFYFEERDDYDLCPVCGWFNDGFQKEYLVHMILMMSFLKWILAKEHPQWVKLREEMVTNYI